MLDKFKAYFNNNAGEETPEEREHHLRLASAALLIEVAIIDQNFDDAEIEAMNQILQNKFSITPKETNELIQLAKTESDDATSMYQFTRLLNDSCDQKQKFKLLEGMWTIAYADGNIDKYEEYMIRKISDLLYMSHSDFIRAKHNVKANL